eukprot:CAMPEP_0172737982 /NCGR_PEP_ID=MMETSP1074-20121228/119132_1 /TAXON_ID=2916 /ORGANISM="Ceratium fusus, Strain PA161109" /LENGTH=85 /DNA_ID=CAMNT_0013567519 /DNA_START=27 /DNA_END=282 /DNA_ORIENTATION=-
MPAFAQDSREGPQDPVVGEDALSLIEHLRKAEIRVDRLGSELNAEREQKERYKGMMTQQYAVIEQLRDALIDQQNAVTAIFQDSS